MGADPAFEADHVPTTRGRPVAQAVVGIAAALLILIAAVLVLVSFASYASVKHRLDAFASDHDANLSRARFHSVVWQIRLASALLVVAGGAVHLRRRRLAELLDAFVRSAGADAQAAVLALRRAVVAESRLHLAALGAISLGALLVRLDFISQPMRYDEADTYVHYASRPLYIGLTTYTAPNNHLLNTLLVHVTTRLFGDQPWAIRLPALVAGVLLVPATYLAARLLYDKTPALVAAALVATSSTLIEYSTNARGYTLVALITVLLVALGSHLAGSKSPAGWTAFAVLAALGFWTIPIMLYALGTVVVWLCWTIVVDRHDAALVRARLLPALAGTAVLTVLLYAPVLATSGPHALLGNSFVTPRSSSYVFHRLPSSLGATFARWHRDQPTVLWVLVALGFALAFVLGGRLGRFRVPPAAGALVAVPPLVAIQRVVPFERVWLFLLPLYLISAAAGLLYPARRLAATAGFGAAVAVAAVALCASLAGLEVATRSVYRSEDTSTFRDASDVASLLARTIRPSDRVLSAPPADQILEYYLDAEGLDGGRLLYTGARPTRLFAVVEERAGDFSSLPAVLRRDLSPSEARGLRPVVLRRFPQAVVYRLLSSKRPSG